MRTVGRYDQIPESGRQGANEGDSASQSRIDHQHRLWEENVDLTPKPGWVEATVDYLFGDPVPPFQVSITDVLVEVRGVLENSNGMSATVPPEVLVTLDTKYRPKSKVVVPVLGSYGATGPSTTYIDLLLLTNGNLYWRIEDLDVTSTLHVYQIYLTEFHYRIDQ